MKINLSTFELVVVLLLAMGILCSLSELLGLRLFGYSLSIFSAYLFYQLMQERERRRRRGQRRHRAALSHKEACAA